MHILEETPPFKFFKNAKEKKLQVSTQDLSDYSFVRLKNISCNKNIEDLYHIDLSIFDRDSNKLIKQISFDSLIVNPIELKRGFFMDGNKNHIDVLIPKFCRRFLFCLTPDMPEDEFEIKLNCTIEPFVPLSLDRFK